MLTYKLHLILLAVHASADITSSSDLNCDFSSSCRWRNATGIEDNGDWIINTQYESDTAPLIIPRQLNDGFFAHTSASMGRTVALLVSDVATCQLGGGSIKYWYFKTGTESRLEICTRQPPGSMDFNAMKCYDGISPSFAQQWIFRAIELPPLSQPFELVFRGISYPPMDVVALTDISYTSTLCDVHSNTMQEKRQQSLHLIGYRDWQHLRQTEQYQGQTMIIVSQPELDKKVVDSSVNEKQEFSFDEVKTSTALSDTITPSSATLSLPKTTSTTTEISTNTTSTTKSFTMSATPTSTNDTLANIRLLLRQTAPVLPYIPAFIKILQSGDLWIPTATQTSPGQPHSLHNGKAFGVKQELHVPVQATHIYHVASASGPDIQQDRGLMELFDKINFPAGTTMITTAAPHQLTSKADVSFDRSRKNIYGIKMTNVRPESPPTFHHPKRARKTEDEDVRTFHRQLLRRKEEFRINATIPSNVPQNELVVFRKPTSTESEVAMKLTELIKHLYMGDNDDLKQFLQIPEMKSLTRGMDLTQISKPRGYFNLRKQFMERLMGPTTSLSHGNTPDSLPAPSPRSVKISNNGAEQGAGGSFETEDNAAKLVEFHEGNDVEFSTFGDESKTVSIHIAPHRALNFAAPTANREIDSEESSPRVGASFTPLCPTIDCTFDKRTMCNYVTSVTDANVNGTLRDWAISSKAVLNSLTGIPHDFSKSGSFAYAGGDAVSPHDIFILSSKLPIEIKEAARLDFFAYQAGVKGRLKVCINSINECALNIKGSTIDINARRWKNYYVPLTPNTHAIHFVADGLQDNYAIGLDHIQLLNKYGMAAMQCS